MRYLVTIGVPDGDIPLVSQSVGLIADCFSKLGYQRALPELASLTAPSTVLGQDENVSPEQLKRTLSRWARRVKLDDFVTLYFAGHGASCNGRHFVGLPRTDWKYPTAEALPTEDLLRALTEGTALQNLLLILDTCYSGQAAFDAQNIAAELVTHKLERSLWLITASFPKQQAGDGAFARAFDELIRSGLGATIPCYGIDVIVEDLNPRLPEFQRASWTPIGASSTRFPGFLPNPNFIAEALQGHPLEDRHFYRDDLRLYWKPRAMGSEATFQGGNWYFTGRTEILHRLVSWLDGQTSHGTAYAVTGDPGSGKSAVLGYLVTASDPEELRDTRLQQYLSSQPVRPEPGCVSLALHLKGKSLPDVLSTLALHFGTKPDDVLAHLAARTEKTVLLFDALDESPEAQQIGELLLRPLTGYRHLWLIVGTRRPELRFLGNRIESLDLDKAELKDQDVALYVERLLLAEGENRISPYRGDASAAKEVSSAVAREANGNFLVARIIARSLIERNKTIDLKRERIPRDATEAFGEYLKAVAHRNGWNDQALRHSLLPLAYAQGQGLTAEVWTCLANTNAGNIRKIAEAFIAEYAEDGRSVYRLFHEALAEALREPKLDAERHCEVAQKLIDSVPNRNWLRANWYTRKYLAVHAAHGDPALLDRLVLDTGFLVAAETRRLLSVSGTARGEEPNRRLNWLGLASDQLPGQREADALSYLELVALLNGAPDLAETTDAVGTAYAIKMKWRAKWARWRPLTPHRVLRGHEFAVSAVAAADASANC